MSAALSYGIANVGGEPRENRQYMLCCSVCASDNVDLRSNEETRPRYLAAQETIP